MLYDIYRKESNSMPSEQAQTIGFKTPILQMLIDMFYFEASH